MLSLENLALEKSVSLVERNVNLLYRTNSYTFRLLSKYVTIRLDKNEREYSQKHNLFRKDLFHQYTLIQFWRLFLRYCGNLKMANKGRNM
jgi:hypothetical protein